MTMSWWLLSFRDPVSGRALGKSVIHAPHDLRAAAGAADALGLNPGGDMMGCTLVEPPADEFRYRLMDQGEPIYAH